MRKINFKWIATLAMIVLLAGCEKSDDTIGGMLPKSEKYSQSSKLRSFSDFKEFCAEIEKTMGYSHEELVKYEQSIGFNSFGKLAEQILYPIVENDTNMSYQNLLDVVKKHSDFLQIKTVDQEEYFETKYENSPFRYIVNINRMAKVDSTLFKVFEGGHVTCNSRYYDKLHAMTESEFSGLRGDDPIFTKFYADDDTKGYYGRSVNKRATSGKEQVRVNMYYFEGYRYMMNGRVNIWGGLAVKTKGYRKFSGIWWQARRTVSNNIEGSLSLHGTTLSGKDSGTTFGYKRETALFFFNRPFPVSNPSIYISRVWGYGKIPAVSCNIQLN